MTNREDAFALMCEYTQSESLRRHMICVEIAMRAYAEKFGEDVEKWGIVGLLHDFDYERWPEPPDHPLQGSKILTEKGYPEDVIYAIKSHVDQVPDCPRVSQLDKTLFAVDELCGFIYGGCVNETHRDRRNEGKKRTEKAQTKELCRKSQPGRHYSGCRRAWRGTE